MKHWRILLPLFVFVMLLPMMILRDYTPSNELRYLNIANEAIADGHLFAFTNQGEPYADKPPVYFWFVMLGKLLLGSHQMWFLSLLSIIPALVTLGVMNRWMGLRLGEQDLRTASLMTMCSGLYLGLAIVLRMDMLMCMFITLALYTFWQIYSDEGDTLTKRLLFPLYTFLALFTKGPVGLLVPIAVVVVFCTLQRDRHTLAKVLGWRTWAILLACCGAWFGAVWAEGGTEYLNNLLFHQTIDRAVDAFHHKEPFYYYLITVWYSLAPFSLLVVGTVIVGLFTRELDALERLFATVIATTLVMLSAFSSKLAVYLAPTFPFFVYLCVLMLRRAKIGWLHRTAIGLPATIFALLPIAAIVLPRTNLLTFELDGWCYTAAIVLGVSGVASIWLLWRHARLNPAINTLAIGLLVALFFGGFSLPKLNAEIGYGPLCHTAQAIAETSEADGYYVWKIRRPENMDVYLGEDIVEVSTEEIIAGRCNGGLLMLPARHLAKDESLAALFADYTYTSVGGYRIFDLAVHPVQ